MLNFWRFCSERWSGQKSVASETAKHRGYSEAASLTALGPYDVATRPSSLPRRLDTAVLGKPKTVKHRGKKRTIRGIRKGSGLPLRTFSLGFGVAETAFHLTCVKEMNTSNESRKVMFAQSKHLPSVRTEAFSFSPPTPDLPVDFQHDGNKSYDIHPDAIQYDRNKLDHP